MRIDRVVTGTGDEGVTSLGDGSRVAKFSSRIKACGEVDELNACLGLALTASPLPAEIVYELTRIQQELFDLGADLCVPLPEGSRSRLRLSGSYVDRLEASCARAASELPPLESFIIPGGTPSAAFLHQSRTVARRAERSVWELREEEGDSVNAWVPRYLNRLSDLLFLWARTVMEDRPHSLWENGKLREGDRGKTV